MPLTNRLAAEFIGTFWLVLGGCGSAVLAAAFPNVGIGLLGVSLAFGLTVLTMAYGIGHISGCHLNPAVTAGLIAGGRFKASEAPAYVIAQVAGALAAAFLIKSVALNPGTLAANGFGEHSPSATATAAGYGAGAAFLAEAVLTCFFLLIILGSTDKRAPAGFAPIAIGLGLTLIHLIGIPITATSVNPARSTGTALVTGGWAIAQLWMFWVAPLIGAALPGVTYRVVSAGQSDPWPQDPNERSRIL